MNTSEIITEFSYGYAQQSSAPEWFDRENPLHFCATSGSSALNEWWGFANEAQARKTLLDAAQDCQSFCDKYVEFKGDWYDEASCEIDENEDLEMFVVSCDADPVSNAELVGLISNF